MNERIIELIKSLNLQPHPEGGFYAETYRSGEEMESANGKRNLATSIFFLLTAENVSKFHKIKSDEMWFFHEGNPLTVHLMHDGEYSQLHLGPVDDEGFKPYQMVPAGTIFGSTVEEGYALVSCVVVPGFDFEDFKLYTYDELIQSYPEYGEVIKKLT
ncbi:cupin domain-containing protein [Litoribacter alkaliphilus]|uniref:Cupin domain-containing protein n=1 Tax=Litoribacter ruber TaxID=702568 RepID=A0AAP2CIF4_9BACT|nr:cupin domain-containing protein [Litoribacter alkaliphilus]MBS9525333.1 cupin domain-containing protein [Litoribacter alkaliphilus]